MVVNDVHVVNEYAMLEIIGTRCRIVSHCHPRLVLELVEWHNNLVPSNFAIKVVVVNLLQSLEVDIVCCSFDSELDVELHAFVIVDVGYECRLRCICQ